MKIKQIISDIISREGGFVNHPLDPGGPTKYGVTIRTLSAYLNREATVDDVRNLSKETATDIYEDNYYRGPKIDLLPDKTQAFLLDAAVNHGPASAIRMLQRVCNAAGFGPVGADGIAGPATRGAASAAQQAMRDCFLKALIEERRNVYRQIVAHNPSQKVFINGWLNRLKEF